MRAISKARIQWSGDRVIRLTRKSDLEYARFGLSSEQIGVKTLRDPVSGVREMRRPPGVKIGLLKFDISSTKSCDIGKKCTELVRSQLWSLLGLEWAWGCADCFL